MSPQARVAVIAGSWLAAALLGAAAFCVQAQEMEAVHQTRFPAMPLKPFSTPLTVEVGRLAQEGESALAAGDTAAAQLAFDRAALLVHSPEVEMGLVRTYMQAGEYRRALTFASHAAGAHRNIPAGTALYAWLLQIGGQGRIATATLSEAMQRVPDDPSLRQARASLSQPWPLVSGVLAEAPGRTAPFSSGATVSAAARVAGSGTVIDGGRAVLVPTSLLDPASLIWVRNGLGQTREASVESELEGVGLSVLRLHQPLATALPLILVGREPFAGSPDFTFEYTPGAGDLAAWPLLRQGFFGRLQGDGGLRPLGIDLPPGPRGGPVFDAAGRLAGIAIADPDGTNRIVFAHRLAAQFPAGEPELPGSSPRMPVDELYERALTLTVQLIIGR